MAALEHFRRVLEGSYELIIVDDGSEDATAKWVEEECAQARLIRRSRNGGFSRACNTGIGGCRGRVVALLNNDLRVEPDYFVHLYPHFENDRVFAVTARVFEWDPPIFASGGRVGRFRRGFWSMDFNYDVEGNSSSAWIEQRRLLSAYAIGGFACYDRFKLNSLGGSTNSSHRFSGKIAISHTAVGSEVGRFTTNQEAGLAIESAQPSIPTIRGISSK